MPYKYIVAQSSDAFENAPPVIMKALALLKWAGEQSISDGSQKPFNELLVLGYMESGAIGVCLYGNRILSMLTNF
jgi:hypothetical protein